LVCTFLGHARNRKAYRLSQRPTHRFLESRDIIFDEGGATPQTLFEHIVIEPNDTETIDVEAGGVETETTKAQNVDTGGVDAGNVSTSKPSKSLVPTLASTRPKRTTHTPIHDDDPRYSVSSYSTRKHHAEKAKVAHANVTGDPCTYTQAMARPDAAEWEVACKAERRAFEHMGVYEVVPCPKGRKVVGSKWVFRIKRGPDGEIQKYKARIVAQGFTQIEGVDYNETFAPVAKFASLRVILAIAAERDLEVQQMDVKSAYLNGELKEEIFMEPPPSFDVPDGMVLRLVKAVYGTKQGGRVEADHAVFVRTHGTLSIIALYIDDITMVSKDLGDISWILGMHVTHDRDAGWIAISQQKYIEEILCRD
jgi:hypothetical protein